MIDSVVLVLHAALQTSAAAASPPVASMEAVSASATRRSDLGPRVDVGASVGLGPGFHIRAELAVKRWRYGEVGIAAQTATHFYFLRDPRFDQAGVDVQGSDATFRVAPAVGHTFRFARHRLSFATHLHSGLSLRRQSSRLDDPAHDLTTNHRYAQSFLELGASVSVGVRIRRHFGLNLDALAPLFLSHAPDLAAALLMSTPYVGMSVSYFFVPRELSERRRRRSKRRRSN